MPLIHALNRIRKYSTRFFASGIFLVFCALLLSGCATGERGYYHCFGFDTADDSPEIQILDYQYGSCKYYGICATRYRVAEGGVFSQLGTCGNYPRGKSLYVKWRIKESGKICEDWVDLDKRLPKDMHMHLVHLVIRNEQLFIYLLPSPGDWPGIGLRKPITKRESAWTRKFIIYPEKPAFYPDRIIDQEG